MSIMTTRDIYKAGGECYRRGDVVSAMIRRNLAWVTVKDGDTVFRVVTPLCNDMAPYCPCMSREELKACRHGVAALSYVSKMFKHLIQDDPWKDAENPLRPYPRIYLVRLRPMYWLVPTRPKPAWTQMTGKRPSGPSIAGDASAAVDKDVRATVAELLKNDKARDLFAACFGEPDLPDYKECREEMSYMFREAYTVFGDPPLVRPADFFKAAKARERRGNIYRVAEVRDHHVATFMDRIIQRLVRNMD